MSSLVRPLKIALASSLLAGGVIASGAAQADHDKFRVSIGIGAGHHAAYAPFKVYIDLDTNGGPRRDARAGHRLDYLVQSQLPRGIRLVEDRRAADLVIRADERRFDVHKINDKRGKRYGHVHKGKCVGGEAIASYGYDVRFRLKGYGLDQDRIRGRVAEQLPLMCGYHKAAYGRPLPHDVIRELRLDANQELAAKLAYRIRGYARDARWSKQGHMHRYGYKSSGYENSGYYRYDSPKTGDFYASYSKDRRPSRQSPWHD